jgi:predicted nucleic acid-binding protein
VRYLLDVNLLVALGHTLHAHHARAENWLSRVRPHAEALATCAITELGFVRVSVQSGLQPDVSAALVALAKLKTSSPVPIQLWPDDLGAARLPKYVRKPAELTDGHLLELARAQGAQFVTLDGKIPGALLIA